MNRNTRRRFNQTDARKSRKTGDAKVISKSPKRNLQMVVYKNLGSDKRAGNGSLTRHEPINPALPTNWPKRHEGRKPGFNNVEE